MTYKGTCKYIDNDKVILRTTLRYPPIHEPVDLMESILYIYILCNKTRPILQRVLYALEPINVTILAEKLN